MTSKPDLEASGQIYLEELRDVTSTTDPTARRDCTRYAELGMADPPRDGSLPESAEVTAVLLHALSAPGATDPVEGMLQQQIRHDAAMETLFAERRARGEATLRLLMIADGRMRRARAPEEDAADERPTPVPRPSHLDEGDGGA